MGASVRNASGALKHRWTYSVTIKNTTDRTVQLIESKWSKLDGGIRNTSMQRNPDPDAVSQKHGHGVLGRFPILTPEKNIFKYSATVFLRRESGSLW